MNNKRTLTINDKINYRALGTKYGYDKNWGIFGCTPLSGRKAADIKNFYSDISVARNWTLCKKYGVRL
jgi:hypothetical protein